VTPIRDAIAHPGAVVAIEGVVTAPAGLLDTDARRLTIQDASGAVLLRLIDGDVAPAVGEGVRVRGTIGRYFGAPQFAASAALERLGQRGQPSPYRLTRAPVPASLEWRLVTAAGRLIHVRRFGGAWTAELELPGGDRLPLVGLARAGISPSLLADGRSATVTAIVRRPYPTAKDRRLALVPRSVSDLALGPMPRAANPATSGRPAGDGLVGALLAGAGPAAVAPVDADLGTLAAEIGRLVRVGGLVAAIEGTSVTIEDGTATAVLRLPATARQLVQGLVIGEPLNAVGRVVAAGGGWEVVVTDAADISRVGRLAPALTPTPTAPLPAPGAPQLSGPDLTAGAAPAALAALSISGALGLFGAATTWTRRRRMERLFWERVRRRLAEVAGTTHEPRSQA
jgi:hypothetical protein